MSQIKRFEELHAWQRARELMRLIYAHTSTGTLAQDFDLRKQLRRAALSVMANISEGYGRRGEREFIHFLNMARGSAFEIQSLLYVAVDIHGMDQLTFGRIYQVAEGCIALIGGLSNHLRKKLEQVSKEH
ncbi:four helix bundle protein [bacterium]|nr:four helix bundle protein [bacterium]